jgi:hypothetical protein
MTTTTKLTAELVRHHLDYELETGKFRWKVGPRAGREAGCFEKFSGYWVIRLNGRLERGHRLAWIHVHGEVPQGRVRHVNKDRADNRIVNLSCTADKL